MNTRTPAERVTAAAAREASPTRVVNDYLTAFYQGDHARARDLLVVTGPFLTMVGADAFFAGASGLLPVVRGHRLRRQWADGAEVCSIYDVELTGPAGSGAITMGEWHSVLNGRLASSQVLFDTAAFRNVLAPS